MKHRTPGTSVEVVQALYCIRVMAQLSELTSANQDHGSLLVIKVLRRSGIDAKIDPPMKAAYLARGVIETTGIRNASAGGALSRCRGTWAGPHG